MFSFDYLSTSHLAILQIGFGTVSWVFVLQCTVSDRYWVVVTTNLTPYSGSSCGSIAQYAIERQTGLRKRELLSYLYYKTRLEVNVTSLDARGRAPLPDCSVSCSIS